jgi:hypothetical protein
MRAVDLLPDDARSATGDGKWSTLYPGFRSPDFRR